MPRRGRGVALPQGGACREGGGGGKSGDLASGLAVLGWGVGGLAWVQAGRLGGAEVKKIWRTGRNQFRWR